MELRLASGHFSVAGAELADEVVAARANTQSHFSSSEKPLCSVLLFCREALPEKDKNPLTRAKTLENYRFFSFLCPAFTSSVKVSTNKLLGFRRREVW